MPLLDIENLTLRLRREHDSVTSAAPVSVVEGVSLRVEAGKITCLVGESGCGKSLTARAVPRLLPAGFTASGRITLDGQVLSDLPEKAMRALRGRDIGMIFQEPMTALNPVLTVGFQAAEPLRRHLGMDNAAAHRRVLELFTQVGIAAPEIRAAEYPHQLSGGMRQRVMIAMALACRPRLLLADEPTTALDVTIQNQILRLLRELTETQGMGLLLITHDLGVVASMADSVGVMYAGRLVEYAPAASLLHAPLHPYTQGLMRCIPALSAQPPQLLPVIEGTVPAPGSVPQGCVFRSRCAQAVERCAQEAPQLSRGEHRVACWQARCQ